VFAGSISFEAKPETKMFPHDDVAPKNPRKLST
jgi:hypothetical protein